ncbi:MAG: hypothetical protein WC841_03150 [Candidatus Shapirobacteria bacterium]|jgi:hypothetical protein
MAKPKTIIPPVTPPQTTNTPPLANSNGPLGIDPTSLGTIKAKDLTGNRPLASTILTYTKNCESKITQLETENETLKTYANDYQLNKYKALNSVVLNLFATILIGIGINFITSEHSVPIGKTDYQVVGAIVMMVIGGILYLYSQVTLLRDRQ